MAVTLEYRNNKNTAGAMVPAVSGGQNNGGVLGGIGYLGEKAGLGFLSSVEGIWDYAAGGMAKLFGADQWAERQFVNDWVDYGHADEWYDPSRGWQIAGDVAGGIGTSLPAIAGVGAGLGIAALSGGTLTPVAAGIISGSVAGLGAAGNATKSAYQKTGQLSGKEFAYGALSGATEAGIELLTAGLGTGTGRIVSSLSKRAAGETVQTLARSGARSVIPHLAADFASEAIEEGLAEVLDPYYRRWTVDPEAKNATAKEIGYSALIGGLSGLVMSGGAVAASTTANLFSGDSAIKNGTAERILNTARQISEYEDANDTGYDSFRGIREGYRQLAQSLSTTGGQISTVKQKMLLGGLKQAETAAFIEPFVERSAMNLLIHADSAAERFSALGMKDADGRALTYTADQIRSGISADLVEKMQAGKLNTAERRQLTRQVRAAMKNNSVLTSLAVTDATGRMMLDAEKFAQAALDGSQIADTADLNRFLETANGTQIEALSQKLGITDWSALTIDDFRAKVAAFNSGAEGATYRRQMSIVRDAQKISQDESKRLPRLFRSNTVPQGLTRYRSEDGTVDMALIRDGDRYALYDYESGNVSREMALGEVNSVIRSYWTGTAQKAISETAQGTETAENPVAVQTVRLNMLASENIPEWRGLSEPNRAAVRMTMRQAEAAGLDEKTAITFGRVAAHSGMNIIFSSDRSGAGDAKINENTIYIDPTASKARMESRLLLHEAGHALMRGKGGQQLIHDVFQQVAPERAQEIAQKYIQLYREQGMQAAQFMPIVNEEIAAAGIEDVLGDANAWEYILSEEPSMGEKFLNFFRGAARDYSTNEGLSSEARKLLFSYRKMFNELSERNRGNNAVELAREDNKKTVTRMNEENMQVTGERYALVGRTEDGRGIYQSNYPENTPKTIKQNDIINLVQNVWSKKPIKLDLIENGKIVSIEAKFNPELTERSDLSKIAFGNRKGNASEKRITMNLSSDLYQIAEDSHYVGSKIESGKDNAAHRGAFTWHYFITNLVYVESDGTKIDCYMNIDVKQNDAGNWFYSFAIEKGSRPADVLSVVTDKSATTSTVSISENDPKVNRNAEIFSKDRLALPEDKALDALLDEKIKVQNRLAELGKLKKDIESSQEYNDIVSKIVNSEKSAMDDVIQEYNEWAKRSKYNEIVEEIKSLDDSESKLIRQYRELQEQKAVFDEQKNIETTGLSENEYFRKQAVKEFGYTPYFYDAGYMLQNGKLLNFSGEKGRHFGSRGEDHRAIGQIFANLNGGKALVKFMSYGNIRVMAETPGIDIFATEEPTSEQYSGIRKFVREYAKEGYFAVDITDENGRVIGTYSYENNINAERVVNDIKYYYQHGELREQSSIANFRYALPEEGSEGKKGDKKKYHKSPGQLRASVANSIHKKAYSKADAREALKDLTGTSMLTKKTQEELADYLWQGFNACETEAERKKFAESFSMAVMEKLLDLEADAPDAQMYEDRADQLHSGIGRLMLANTPYEGDLRHILDKDGYRRFLARWGFKQSSGGKRPYAADQFVNDIAGEVPGMEHLREMHIADALVEIDRMYTEASLEAGEVVNPFDNLSANERGAMVFGFEKQILQAFEQRGKQSVFAREVGYVVENYAQMAQRARAEYDEINGRNKILNMIDAQAKKMKDLKLGTFANATQMDSDDFKGSIQQLANIEYRGNLSVTMAKSALRNLAQWYTTDNNVLQYVDDQNVGLYHRGIAEMLHELTADDAPFTKEQLGMLHDVMSYFVKFVENYGKIWRGGKRVEAKPIAQGYVDTLHENDTFGLSLTDRMMRTRYLVNFGDPAAVVRHADRYRSGFFTEMYDELRAAAEESDVQLMEIMKDYDAFMKKHPKYKREAAKETIVWTEAGRTNAMPKMTAISLYMTSKRDHAQAGLALNGFKFEDPDGKMVRPAGAILRNVDDPKKVTQEQIREAMSDLQKRIREQLSAEDLEYIKILEKAYGYDLRNLKVERDMERQGFTNATLGYYYPIRRADIAKSVDVSAFSELDRVSNASFNKSIVQGARGKLFIEDADTLFHRHATAVTRYYALSPAIDNFNILFNMDVSGNPNNSVSVATESENQWKGAKEYFRDLIGDIQGKPKSAGEFDKGLSALRSHVAMSQLGANPKTWVTQLSSLFASTSILDPTSIINGLRYGGSDVDKYCSLAELRNYEGAAVKAQGVLDRVGRVGEVLMKPIGGMDRLVVKALWGACQVQVSKDQSLKIGTEENKVAAGKMLEKVLFETQQNSLATERSAAMRSGSELVRALTMFSADGMKVTARFLDGLGEVSTLKKRIEVAKDGEKEAIQEQLKTAQKATRRALTAMLSSAAFGVAVAELFRALYNKEREEDESAAVDITLDFIGNLLGGLPGLRDAYTYMVDGYEMDNYAISAVNDLLSSVKSSFTLTWDIIRGEKDVSEVPGKIRSLAYTAGQFTGIPVRNIYNTLTGLTRRISPNAGYQIDRFFTNKNERNDLKKAIEAGDTRRVALLTGIIHGKDATGEIGDAGMSELNRMALAGYSILPRTISDKITVNGEEVELDKGQVEALEDGYADAWSGAVASLLESSVYRAMTDEQKQKAIRKAHDIAYESALSDIGIDRGERSVTLASVLGTSLTAAYYAAISGIESDVDASGETVEGSRRAKIVSAIGSLGVSREQKLMLICAAGYSLRDGDLRGMNTRAEKLLLIRYILKMPGKSAAQKAAIAEMCGFEVKGGRVMVSSLQ